ncbi:MAG: hypothetical protein LQ352_001299 [Teloschistes flavicans]|nr:MAG: hypothetical protein LQ352_001299 [Teloschistes flavicans]
MSSSPGSKASRARKYLHTGGVLREDSDDELGYDDLPWEWIYPDETDSENAEDQPVGARMGDFECAIGDCCLLKAEGTNEAWVGIICAFVEDEDGKKAANFMWFSTEKEIRNKQKKRTDALPNEVYITPAWDLNPLPSINGKATVVSEKSFRAKYPSGKVPRKSKDFGKIFVCRRGCATRTATYTDEFIWEEKYRGVEDLLDLVDFVKAQTRATRKRKRGVDDPALDYDPTDDISAVGPRTPSKKRKYSSTSTPTKTPKRTPSKLHLTPSHKRVIVKKPLTFTPLSTRVLSPHHVNSSPFQLARSTLHVSSIPATLPCREEEFDVVYTHLEAAISAGSGACIYISGTPGTGKTATVREVVAQLNASVLVEELDDFIFVEINGMKITEPHQSYSLLWEALKGERVSPSHALGLLEREFDHPSPRRVPCVVLMDELDQLVTKDQSVMYNFFNWPGLRHSRLTVLAVANTMDLPERTLSNKISSRLGLTRITFPGYTHGQLQAIISSRLVHVPGQIVDPDAIQFASRKVAAVSGDARRALDICRRAVEIAEGEVTEDGNPLLATPSKRERAKGKGEEVTRARKVVKAGNVTIATIKQAINEATSSSLQQYLRSLPLSSKLFLASVLASIRRTGVGECVLGEVVDGAKKLALMAVDNPKIQEILLMNGFPGRDRSLGKLASPAKSAIMKRADCGPAPRVHGMGTAATVLAEAGVVGLEGRRGERVGKVRLNVGEDEVRLALRDDSETLGLGFQ